MMSISGNGNCEEFLKAFNVPVHNLMSATITFKPDSMVTIETEYLVDKTDLDHATEIMVKRFKLVEMEGK